jgi:hypothetical protein
MKFVNATKLDRKSGVAERRDLRFHFRAQQKWRGRIASGVPQRALFMDARLQPSATIRGCFASYRHP